MNNSNTQWVKKKDKKKIREIELNFNSNFKYPVIRLVVSKYLSPEVLFMERKVCFA